MDLALPAGEHRLDYDHVPIATHFDGCCGGVQLLLLLLKSEIIFHKHKYACRDADIVRHLT